MLNSEKFFQYDFELDTERILENTDKNTKLIFICSPNNPTSNNFKREDIVRIIENSLKSQFSYLVIIDEAYIDFSVNEKLI